MYNYVAEDDWCTLRECLTPNGWAAVLAALDETDEPLRLTDADLLRYAPYADERANRVYRATNGIKERE